MPKIFALRDRLMEVQQSLTIDDVDVRSKRVVNDVDKFDDFDDHHHHQAKSFGLQIFESFFNRKVTDSTPCWHQPAPEPTLIIEGKSKTQGAQILSWLPYVFDLFWDKNKLMFRISPAMGYLEVAQIQPKLMKVNVFV